MTDLGAMEKANISDKSGGNGFLKKLPLFWRYMLYMGTILLVSLIVLFILNQRYLNTLSEELLSEMQTKLEQDCDKLDQKLYATITIPSNMEQSRYYRYISGPRNGELELKYYPVLDLLRKALQQQNYLTADAEETLLYLHHYNSIVGTGYYEPDAEDYFLTHLEYSNTGPEEVLALLKSRQSMAVLPIEKLVLDGGDKECLTVILHPINSPISIMSMYAKDTILRDLGIDQLEEACWMLNGPDGQLLGSSDGIKKVTGADHVLSGMLQSLQIEVRVGIPNTYFQKMLRNNRRTGNIAILLVAAFGLFLAILFSRLSVLPIKKLISTHGTAKKNDNVNELLRLDELLINSKENEKRMSTEIRKQILAKSFYGGVLMDQEVRMLQEIPYMDKGFRAAVFLSDPRINAVLGEQLTRSIPECVYAAMSQQETVCLYPAGEEKTTELTKMVYTMNDQMESADIHCGISMPAEGISGLDKAVREARRALPADPGLNVFQGGSHEGSAVSWVQHERLYQCVMNNDEEDAFKLVESMTQDVPAGQFNELFHVISFVLQNAASEAGVVFPTEFDREYHPNLTTKDNYQNLHKMLQWIFDSIRIQKQNEQENRKNEILKYIRKQLSDSELTAAYAAGEFGMSEKKIYETVRIMTGKSFKEYLTDLRMKKAAELLRGTNEEISEIAAQCGYSNSSTFYRLFQNYFGTSPGSFRKKERGNQEAAGSSESENGKSDSENEN